MTEKKERSVIRSWGRAVLSMKNGAQQLSDLVHEAQKAIKNIDVASLELDEQTALEFNEHIAITTMICELALAFAQNPSRRDGSCPATTEEF